MSGRGPRQAAVTILLIGWLAFALAGRSAAAGGGPAPFFDQPEALRHAFGTESVSVRLTAASAVAGGDEGDEAAELLQEARETYLPLFAASLEGRDADLARRLAVALEQAEVAAKRGDGDGLVDSLIEAHARVAEAREVLVSQELLTDPGFSAALAFTLLLWEGGLAEGFEEAVEEGQWEEYLIGWAALQHVDGLWQRVLRPAVSAEGAGEIEDLLDRLKALFAVLEARGALAHDPEEGETWAHLLVGSLERLTEAELYPDREPGRLVAFLHAQSQQACASPEVVDSAPSREGLRWAAILYEEHLSSVAGLFLPAAAETVEETLEALAAGSVEAEAACSALLAGLEEMASVFGG